LKEINMGTKVRFKRIGYLLALVVVAGLLGANGVAKAAEYPLRAEYPSVKPIETNELTAVYGKAIIVDVRNTAEFDVIHIDGAANILVGKMTEQDLMKLRPKDDGRLLVFYCNGVTCAKSYKAAKHAGEWGFKNVRCYDPGIFDWAKVNPGKAKFFGKILSDAELKASIISDSEFKKVLLTPKEFMARTKTGDYTVIDIRDPDERSETQFSMPKMKVMSFDTMVNLLNTNSKAIPSSNVLIVDNVGKQVQWLQYYLKKAGIKNYYFAEGGLRQLKKEGF
jgi:rhodanese-related sulfurtransferase